MVVPCNDAHNMFLNNAMFSHSMSLRAFWSDVNEILVTYELQDLSFSDWMVYKSQYDVNPLQLVNVLVLYVGTNNLLVISTYRAIIRALTKFIDDIHVHNNCLKDFDVKNPFMHREEIKHRWSLWEKTRLRKPYRFFTPCRHTYRIQFWRMQSNISFVISSLKAWF